MKKSEGIGSILRILLILIAIIGISLGLKGIIIKAFYNKDYTEQSYTEQYIVENAIDMESIGESNFKTTSIDCQIPIRQEKIKKIQVDLEIPNQEVLSGAIYYGNYDTWVPVGFRNGINKIELPTNTGNIRIDLTDQVGKMIKINSIIVNPKNGVDNTDYMDLIMVIVGAIVLIGSLFFYNNLIMWILDHKSLTIMVAMTGAIVIYVFDQSGKHGINSISYSLFISVMLLMVLGVGLLGIKRIEKVNIVGVFVFLATVFGVLFAVLLPPMQGPDEDVHWIRSYYLGVGNIGYKPELGDIPESVQNYLSTVNAKDIPFHYGNKVNKQFFFDAMDMPLAKDNVQVLSDGGRTKTYLTYAYLPQSIGIAIGNLLDLSPYWILLLGRLTNLMVWIIICSLALHIMPIRKELFLLILLLPMNIHQAANLSPDVVLNASSYMLLAYIFYLKFKKEYVLLRDIGIIIICGIGIVGVKFPYIILMLLIWIIPGRKFCINQNHSTMLQTVVKFLYLCMCISVSVIFFVLNQKFLVEYDTMVSTGETLGIIQVLLDTLMNLGTYLKIMMATLVHNMEFYMQSMIGVFGWLDAPMPDFVILYIVLTMVILSSIPDSKEYKLSCMDRGIMMVIAVGFVQMLILVGIQWSGKNWTEIRQVSGIQGRYFLPFFLMIALIFSNNFISYKKTVVDVLYVRRTLYLSICFIHIISIGTLIFRYWI